VISGPSGRDTTHFVECEQTAYFRNMNTNKIVNRFEFIPGLNHNFAIGRQTKSGAAAASARPVAILGIVFNNITMAAILKRIQSMVAARRPHYLVTANVDFLVQARRDAELRRVLNSAEAVLCDGMPLVWASRWLGNPLPERVAGSDLVPQLLELAEKHKYHVFFLGASPEANEQAVANVRAQYPAIRISHYSPPFRPLPEMEDEDICRRIRAAKPDILLVAFGCPKAEKWIARNFRSLGVPVTIGVGATIDFLAGKVVRAPIWMQRAGAEWLFRLCQEPRRLLPRYMNDLWKFGLALISQVWLMRNRGNRAESGNSGLVTVSQPTWWRIQAPKRLDIEAGALLDKLRLSRNNRHCLLDLSGVEFIDSAGAGWLLQLRKEFLETKAGLVLLAPSPTVQRVLKHMRATSLFTTASTALEARHLIDAELPPPSAKGAPRPVRLARHRLEGHCLPTRRLNPFSMGGTASLT
jgi:N-acetylglucosaminyldiphosphoundecaprenol N-acetyl-beta-D-mannosaminyltransferase